MWIAAAVVLGIAALILAPRFLASKPAPMPGSVAPEFALVSEDGSQVSLRDYRGKWVVLYFYPKDFTSGCTVEAHNFQRDQAEFAKRNAVVLGVSGDSDESHKKFCAKEGLNFKLLSDTGGKVSQQYGSTMEYNGATYSARNTFIIDPQGKVAKVFEKVNPGGHSEEVLAALASLQKH